MLKQQPERRGLRWLALVAVIAAIAVPGFINPTSSHAGITFQSPARARRAGVPALGGIDKFQELFQRDAGNVRLVVLISPT